MKAIGIDLYNQCTTGEVAKTLNAIKSDADHIPCVIVGGVWTIDEKMGNTYCHHEQANTLASRDYKQPQAVIYEIESNICGQMESDLSRGSDVDTSNDERNRGR